MTYISNIVRSPGDPKVYRSGPSSRQMPDRLADGLGWFSIALGLTEVIAAERLTQALGMEGSEGLVRAYGAREIAAGMVCLSVDKPVGLWSRVAGDALDIASLATAFRPENPKRGNLGLAFAAVLGVTLLDLVCAQAVSARHSRARGRVRQYQDRSGFPQGLEAARGAARNLGAAKKSSARQSKIVAESAS